jgi:hypothetical protein
MNLLKHTEISPTIYYGKVAQNYSLDEFSTSDYQHCLKARGNWIDSLTIMEQSMGLRKQWTKWPGSSSLLLEMAA